MLETALYPQTHTPTWFESTTGRRIYPTEPDHADVCIEDIAHALSHCCRFAGHCRQLYTVAQHSLLVYRLVRLHNANTETLKWALLHDSAEAYVHDITRPLKYAKEMKGYKDLETNWQVHICMALGIDICMVDLDLVKEADNHALKLEAEALMPSQGEKWGIPDTRAFEGGAGWFHLVAAFFPEQAKAEFLRVWSSLDVCG